MTKAMGSVILRAQETMLRRTFQPVRRHSYNLGERELHLWRPVDGREVRARLQAAREFDKVHKIPGRRNGALGHVGVEVLEALYGLVCYRTGRLEPSIDWICARIRRSRAAVVRAMARLKLHGFLSWIRRTEPTGAKEGPQVRQITNAYVFGLPRDVAAWVAKKLGRKPKDAIEADDRVRDAREAFNRNRPSAPLPDDVRSKLHKRAAERVGASSPKRQSPGKGG